MKVVDPDELLLAIVRYLGEDEPGYIQLKEGEDDSDE